MGLKKTILFAAAVVVLSMCVSAQAAWTEPVHLSELGTPSWPAISSDGSIIFFLRQDSNGTNYFWEAQINEETGLYDEPRIASEIGNMGGKEVYGVWMSEDSHRMYHCWCDSNVNGQGWGRTLSMAERNDSDELWQRTRNHDELQQGYYALDSVSLTLDELNIMWEALPYGGDTFEVFTASRSSKNSGFSNIRSVPELDYVGIKSPYMTANGLTVYFRIMNDDGFSEIWKGTRNTFQEPFGDFEPLDDINRPGVNFSHPRITADGSALYFTRYGPDLEHSEIGIFVSYNQQAESGCHFKLAGDVNDDCKFDLTDLALMAQSWLIDCDDTPDATQCIPLDIDGDGFDVNADCDDNNPSIYPGADEIWYDGIDQDCDGASDFDKDKDGFDSSFRGGTDCDDNDPTIYPGAVEIPNDGIDQDCDGSDLLAEIEWVSIIDPGTGSGGFAGDMSKYETTNYQYCAFLNEALASGDIDFDIADSNRVIGANGSNGGADFAGELYFELSDYSGTGRITFSDGTFSVSTRKDNSNNDVDMGYHPVVLVSWYGATAFCNYYGYRLPAEVEWQAVADYDGSYGYGCGNLIDSSKANYNGNNPLDLFYYPFTSPVNNYPSYGYELNDMAGNVWEWTSTDSYGDRIYRGGHFDDADHNCTVSANLGSSPDYTSLTIGFRVCR